MSDKKTKDSRPSYTEFTLDMFSRSSGKNHSEIKQFNQWRNDIISSFLYFLLDMEQILEWFPVIFIKEIM